MRDLLILFTVKDKYTMFTKQIIVVCPCAINDLFGVIDELQYNEYFN